MPSRSHRHSVAQCGRNMWYFHLWSCMNGLLPAVRHSGFLCHQNSSCLPNDVRLWSRHSAFFIAHSTCMWYALTVPEWAELLVAFLFPLTARSKPRSSRAPFGIKLYVGSLCYSLLPILPTGQVHFRDDARDYPWAQVPSTFPTQHARE